MTAQPYIVFGDFTAAVIDMLDGDSHLSGFNIKTITSDLKDYERGDTYVLVEQLGGSYKFLYVKRPRIDIIVFSAKRSTAYDISAACQAIVFNRQNNYRANGVNLCAVEVETDIFLSEEKDTSQFRYIQSLRLICKPYPG